MNTTIRDIAEKSGVSIATVSRVINKTGYASEKVKKKVLSVAEELNYRPNGVARSLKMHKTNMIGIVIPDISNPYFMKISKGIEDTIEKEDYILTFVSADENPAKEKKTLQVLLENRVEAIVLATSSGDNSELIEEMQQTNVPIMLIDRKLKSPSSNLDLVVEDNMEGAYQLSKFIFNEGYRDVGVINGSLKVSTGMERYEGYQKALKEFNITENKNLVFNGNFGQRDGETAIIHFFEQEKKPTAILSFNNAMTYGAILQLSKMGLSVPDDIIVASYGETDIDQLLKPPGIISVKQSPYEMGVRVGEILLKRIENKDGAAIHEVFAPVIDFKH